MGGKISNNDNKSKRNGNIYVKEFNCQLMLKI